MRENEQRVYRIDCYYLAKFFSETPLYSILPTVTALIVYPWTEVAQLGSRALFLITTTMGFAGNIGRSLGKLLSFITSFEAERFTTRGNLTFLCVFRLFGLNSRR